MPAFSKRIQKANQRQFEQGLQRKITPCDGGNTTTIRYGGRNLLNFSNNDYLGMANDPRLNKAFQQGIDLYGSGSGGSPLVSGFSRAHQLLESSLCDWLGYERALLFSSGFAANQALVTTLLQKGDLLLQDRLNHASLLEAGMMSPAQMRRFRHNDIEHLSSLIEGNQTADTLVVSEGVFSMDGDKAPLEQLLEVCDSKAMLMLDDAHGIGVLGPTGGGSCEMASRQPELLVITFGKAFGVSGAAILCSSEMGEYLTQFARHHVYSTAMPPAQAYALKHAVAIVKSQAWRRERLKEHGHRFHRQLRNIEGVIETRTPIKPLVVGSADSALTLARKLRHQGIHIAAIRPPTVPNNQARLRISLSAAHTEQQVDVLCQTLLQVLGEKQ